MTSSWNTGRLVETAVDAAVESASKAVEEGPSFFDTVVDNASKAMVSGVEAVADATDSAYELIPEADTIKESVSSMVSRIPEPNIPTFNIGAVGETVSNLNQKGEEFAESQKRKICQLETELGGPYFRQERIPAPFGRPYPYTAGPAGACDL